MLLCFSSSFWGDFSREVLKKIKFELFDEIKRKIELVISCDNVEA